MGPFLLFLKNVKLECSSFEKWKGLLHTRGWPIMQYRAGFTFLATKLILPSPVQHETKVCERLQGARGSGETHIMDYTQTAKHTVQTKLTEFKLLVQLSMVFLELLDIFKMGVFGVLHFLSWVIISNCHFTLKSMSWCLRAFSPPFHYFINSSHCFSTHIIN